MRSPFSAIVLSMLVGAFWQVPEGVDFTGRWILESPSSASAETPRALTVRQSVATRTVRGEPMKPFFKDITIEREVGAGTHTETHQVGIGGGTICGVVSAGGTARAPDCGNEHHEVKWDANSLVFETGSYTGPRPETGVWTERREMWSLDSDGRLHVVITTRGSSDAPRTVALVYKRQ